MDYVKIRTVAADHPRFLEAGETAAALWAWGMLYAGRHETDGAIPRVAVLAWPWCSSRSKAIRASYKLVEVGLWSSTETGYAIVGWSEQGNMTKAGLDTERAAARDRMKRRRSRSGSESLDPPSDVRANFGRTSPGVPTSICSSSGSRSGSREGEPERGPPPWFAFDALGLLEMNAPDVHRSVGNVGERWLQYLGAMQRGRGANAQAAASWLTSTVRAERAAAERRKPYEPPPKPIAQTRAEAIDFANELSRRMGLRAAGAT